MKECRPACYDAFHCIGSACTDTCCAGWEIDIDETSYERYQTLTGAVRERLDQEIGTEGETHFFRLKEGRRCPFLNAENLCDLFIEAGEEYLCDICTEHPRFYNWFGSYTEVGLGLCCEEAERLLLGTEKPVSFFIQEWESAEEEEEDPLLQPFLEIRGLLFRLLQNRSRSILQRMRDCLDVAEDIQMLLDVAMEDELSDLLMAYAAGDTERAVKSDLERSNTEESGDFELPDVADIFRELVRFYQGLEALEKSWPEYLRQLEDQIEVLIANREAFLNAYEARVFEYEHLMVYFVYRYFLDGLYTFDVISGIRFAVVSTLIILLCGISDWMKYGELNFEAQCRLVRRYSKEIEYCTENVQAICERLSRLDIRILLG